jgi:lactate dehydrogenase-like 2-hydroxyacid dehydrogenase
LRRDGYRAQVLIPTMARIDGALMDRIDGLRPVQQWSTGLDGVDVPAATARGIKVL